MAITAGMVKELRETTGAGMMDCKKALTETNGDMEAAVELLREERCSKDGKESCQNRCRGYLPVVAVDGNKAVVVEVNSETDFVAKNEVFQAFVQDVADKALASGACGGVNGEDVQTLLDGGLTEEFADKTLKIGEKLSFRRFETVEGDCVASYIHGGGRIGVLVAASGASDAAAKEALTNVAMQIAAMNPQYIAKEDISAEELAKTKEITIDSALNDPASLPKPILNSLFAKAVEGNVFSAEDAAAYEEQKNNKYLFNFLSEAAKKSLAELALADKAAIVENKIFNGLVEGRISKQLKEITLL